MLISGGLELLEMNDFADSAERFLTNGAETIEFLCRSPGTFKVSLREEMLKAAIAYHIASRHARAYVLMEQLKNYPVSKDRFTELIIAILERRIADARQQTVHLFEDEQNNDVIVAGQLSSGEISPEEAIY